MSKMNEIRSEVVKKSKKVLSVSEENWMRSSCPETPKRSIARISKSIS